MKPKPQVRERLGPQLRGRVGNEVGEVEHNDEHAEPRHEQVLNRLEDALAAVVPHAEYDSITVALFEQLQLALRLGFVGLLSDARDSRFL